MLKQISDALKTTGKRVFYGMAGTLDGEDIWDYIVFFRSSLSSTGGKSGMADTYEVAIIQEDYIADETVAAVIKAMTSIPGMRLKDGDMLYNYSRKPNTGAVVEILTIDFVKPKKVCHGG